MYRDLGVNPVNPTMPSKALGISSFKVVLVAVMGYAMVPDGNFRLRPGLGGCAYAEVC